jgi:uncharacterized protein
LITKYTEQQNNVRNNREFDSLAKEIEYQTLEIQLAEKRIKEFTVEMTAKKDSIATVRSRNLTNARTICKKKQRTGRDYRRDQD